MPCNKSLYKDIENYVIEAVDDERWFVCITNNAEDETVIYHHQNQSV